MRIRQTALTLFIALSFLNASSIEEEVAYTVLKNAKKYNIDPKILYTLIDIESAFYPNAICVETNKKSAMILKNLESDSIRIKTGKTYHSKIWMVSIFPKSKADAITMSKQLRSMGFVYDTGLMQINSCNFKLEEAGKMFDVTYNIDKGAKIFNTCTKIFSSFKHQVECYNRGAGNLKKSLRKGKHYYPYYDQYRKKWDF